MTKNRFLTFELEQKYNHYSDLKFYRESKFDIFEGQGPSRDPLKGHVTKNWFFIFELEDKWDKHLYLKFYEESDSDNLQAQKLEPNLTRF